jgi:CHAT domain-containing protein
MRSIPYAALFDGKHFVVEKFGIVTMPSLAFQKVKQKNLQGDVSHQLFAGLSKPDGPSLDKVNRKMVASIESSGLNENPGQDKELQRTELLANLSLPSVEKEIEELADVNSSKVLLNNQFTSESFKSNLETGDYDKVHIASHGYFGKSAKDSFIMSYDETLSLEDFEGSLSTERIKEKPIDLLTLSACQTAQGNDRLLLGFSGMAVKSNVRSALGSLWSIDDEGTMVFMKLFYNSINAPMEKAEALQQAQVAMIKSVKFKHPYYWSPFILTGNWK